MLDAYHGCKKELEYQMNESTRAFEDELGQLFADLQRMIEKREQKDAEINQKRKKAMLQNKLHYLSKIQALGLSKEYGNDQLHATIANSFQPPDKTEYQTAKQELLFVRKILNSLKTVTCV